MDTPIIVLTMARSRSSLVCHILYKHGVWTGKSKPPDEYNPVPYHENNLIHRVIKRNLAKVYDTLKVAEIDNFHSICQEILDGQDYKTPWLIKVDAFNWKLFEGFNPIYIKLYRNPDDILKSIKRTPFMSRHGYTDQRWMEIIKAHQEEMDKLCGWSIDTDKMLTDFSQIRAAIEEIGLDFNEAMTKEIIDHKGYQYC